MRIHLYMLISLGVILSIFDGLLPLPFGVVGAKVGLGNLATLFALIYYGTKEAFFVLFARVFLYAIFFGGMSVFIYSLAGAILSFSMMILTQKIHNNIVSMSAVGGFFHPVGQIIVLSIVLKNTAVFYYLFSLGSIGLVAGILLGIIAQRVERKIHFHKKKKNAS